MSESGLSRKIVPELSAIASRPAPRSICIAAPELSTEARRVVDIGCGYMQGTRELLRHHDAVYAVDSATQQSRVADKIAECEREPAFKGFRTREQFAQSRLRLGGAYVVNVLHTIPSLADRIALLRAARRNLTSTAFLLLDVPYYEHYYKDRMTAANAYEDGYLFRQGADASTFYRFTTTEELDEWAGVAGFSFDFRYVDNHHWVRIYRPA